MLPQIGPRSLRAGSSFLLRPATRSLYSSNTFRLLPTTLPSSQLRTYAKAGKPRKPEQHKPAPTHSASYARPTPSTQSPQPTPTQAETTGSSDKSGKPDYSTIQEEFDTTADGARNTTPQDSSPSAIDPAKAKEQAEEEPVVFHDLTKGIPSTLDAELEASSKKAQSESEVEGQDAASPASGRAQRRMPAGAYETSAERRRNKTLYAMFVAMGLGAVAGVVYFGRDWDSSEEADAHPDVPSGWGFGRFYNRIVARAGTTLDHYTEPAFPKLLPDPDPSWQRPYTLVISLEDLLIHTEWSREHGWRMAKRPGVDYFLKYLQQYYEIVIFTSLPSMTGGPIVQKLDPFQLAMWPLFREATKYKNGEYIKDLSYLNRDLKKVIMIDTDKSHAQLQPENAIIIPKWKGEMGNKGLVALIPFLEYVAGMDMEDTRKVLASFEGKDIPAEFAIREKQARERFHKQLAEEKSKRTRGSGVGFLGSALGIKSDAGMQTMDGMPTLSEGLAQGKMLHDQIRERGQKNYEMIDKQIRETGDAILKEQEEAMKKAQEEGLKNSLSGFKSFFGKSSGEDEKK